MPVKPIKVRPFENAIAISIRNMAFVRGHLENVRGFITNKKQLRDEVDEEEAKALG